VRLFAQRIITNLGILHEDGHPAPWIIAMDAVPTLASVLDDGACWAIEPMFSDFKGWGFNLEASQLLHAESLVLIMALAMYGCVSVGRDKARHHPTPREKSPGATRPHALALQETLSQHGLVVHPRFAPPRAVPSKRPPVRCLLSWPVSNG
jgi:hypothetical protein